MLSTAFNIARSGLAVEGLRMQVAAQNIANASTPGFVPSRVQASPIPTGGVAAEARPVRALAGTLPQVDLVYEVASLSEARAAYEANLAVIETVDEMFQSLLDAVDPHDHEHRHCRADCSPAA